MARASSGLWPRHVTRRRSLRRRTGAAALGLGIVAILGAIAFLAPDVLVQARARLDARALLGTLAEAIARTPAPAGATRGEAPPGGASATASTVGFEPGVYFGWARAEGLAASDGGAAAAAGVLRFAGWACPDDDPAVTLTIPAAPTPIRLSRSEIVTEHADLDLPQRVPGTSLTPAPAPREGPGVSFRRVLARCRSGAERWWDVGRAHLAYLPGGAGIAWPLGVRIVASEPAPARGVLAALTIANDGDQAVTLTRVAYAPEAAATGRVRAAAGSRAQAAAWRWVVMGPGNGAVDPATLTPWHRAYQSPDDAGALRTRSADDVALALAPGDVALIVIDHASLVPTRRPLRAILHPVLFVAASDDPARAAAVGSPLAAVGWTPSTTSGARSIGSASPR